MYSSTRVLSQYVYRRSHATVCFSLITITIQTSQSREWRIEKISISLLIRSMYAQRIHPSTHLPKPKTTTHLQKRRAMHAYHPVPYYKLLPPPSSPPALPLHFWPSQTIPTPTSSQLPHHLGQPQHVTPEPRHGVMIIDIPERRALLRVEAAHLLLAALVAGVLEAVDVQRRDVDYGVVVCYCGGGLVCVFLGG